VPTEAHKPFTTIFEGRKDCLGLYFLEGSPEPGKKWEGKAISYPNSRHPDRMLTEDDYVNHFNGLAALGVVPVKLDGTCKWFVIDVDDYKIDHLALSKKIFTHNIPLVHCRSKSGGAHLYGLVNEFVKASDVILLAKKWCETLGFDPKRTEIFPKQTKFDNAEAKGNWVIIPYFAGEKAVDFAIDDNGKKVDFVDFAKFAEARIITKDEFYHALKHGNIKTLSQDEIWEQSPPCINEMRAQKVKEGDGRNNAASHLSWYYRSVDEFFETTDWKDKLDQFNQAYFDPPLSYTELNQVIKNHSTGKYKARCEVNPMANFCDKPQCIKRKFGIKQQSDIFGNFQITSITKIDLGDDPIWRVYVNGQAVTMDTETLMTPRKFRQTVLARLNILIPPLKQPQHDEILAPIISDALVIEEAELVSSFGKVDSCFRQWISQTIEKSHNQEKLLDGLPWFNDKESQIWFRLHDFVLEYRRVYKEQIEDKEIYVVLKAANYGTWHQIISSRPTNLMTYTISEEDKWFNIKKEGAF